MIVDTYGEDTISKRTCQLWFQRFNVADFGVEDKERPGPSKKFEDTELEALLAEDSTQTQQELAESLGVAQQTVSHRLNCMGMVQKQGHWVPHRLRPKDIERRLFTCEQLLQRKRGKAFCIGSSLVMKNGYFMIT